VSTKRLVYFSPTTQIPSSLSEVARNFKVIQQEQKRSSTYSFAQHKTQNNQTTHQAAEHSAPQYNQQKADPNNSIALRFHQLQ
jgi:hypothetical protein